MKRSRVYWKTQSNWLIDTAPFITDIVKVNEINFEHPKRQSMKENVIMNN